MFSQLCQLTKSDKCKERLNWDEYFMSIALLASQRSPCNRLHVQKPYKKVFQFFYV